MPGTKVKRIGSFCYKTLISDCFQWSLYHLQSSKWQVPQKRLFPCPCSPEIPQRISSSSTIWTCLSHLSGPLLYLLYSRSAFSSVLRHSLPRRSSLLLCHDPQPQPGATPLRALLNILASSPHTGLVSWPPRTKGQRHPRPPQILCPGTG